MRSRDGEGQVQSMSEQWPNPFSGGGRFVANPHLYDYVHTLVFDPVGTVEMVDGAGQVLNTLVKGHFTVEERGPAAFLVSFADLVEIDPYYRLKRFGNLDRDAFSKAVRENVPYEEGDVRSRPDPCSVNVAREEGLFLLRRHIVWNIKDKQEWPYLLYRVRYRFAFDPLAEHISNRQRNLYYQSEAPEPDTRVYYRAEDAQALTARELAQAGIAIEDEQR